MLLMVEKGIRGEEEYVTLFIDMQKLITNNMKDYVKKRIVISSILGCK